MKVAIGGSRRLPEGQAPRLVVRFLAALPADAVVLLRSPMTAQPGEFEQSVARLCDALRLGIVWCRPKPTEETYGRASVYVRDIEMVEQAHLVVLFFTPDEATDGYSGTAHLMEKALDADRPTYAYAVDDDGEITRVGEYDPEHQFVDIAPRA